MISRSDIAVGAQGVRTQTVPKMGRTVVVVVKFIQMVGQVKSYSCKSLNLHVLNTAPFLCHKNNPHVCVHRAALAWINLTDVGTELFLGERYKRSKETLVLRIKNKKFLRCFRKCHLIGSAVGFP